MPRTCWKCGKEVADGQMFCGACGANMSGPDMQGPQNSYSTPPGYGGGYGGPNGGGYGGPPYGGGYGGRLQTDRSLIMYILLTIVTCGIYSYYFIYKMAQDVNTACEGDGDNTSGLLTFILLSYVTCGIYAIYWEYALGNRLAANAYRYGFSFQENGTTVLMWYLVGLLLCGLGPFIAMHILIKNTNAICMAYNQYNNL